MPSTLVISNPDSHLLQSLNCVAFRDDKQGRRQFLSRSGKGEQVALLVDTDPGRLLEASRELSELSQSYQNLKQAASEFKDKVGLLEERTRDLVLEVFKLSHSFPKLTMTQTGTDRNGYYTKVGKFQVMETIATGTTGLIRRVETTNADPTKPPNLAAKVIEKKTITTLEAIWSIQNEIRVMKSLDHPNVVKFIDVFQDQDLVFLVMERVQADLFQYLQYYPGGVGLATAQSIAYQVLAAIQALHDTCISHRDIKPENILINVAVRSSNKEHNIEAKLADFGSCEPVILAEDSKTSSIRVGTVGWLAPEVFNPQNPINNGLSLDIWSFGIVLMELLLGSTHFNEVWLAGFDGLVIHDLPGLLRATQGGLARLQAAVGPGGRVPGLPAPALALLQGCLQPNPQRRPPAGELLRHPFFQLSFPPSAAALN